jgi:hypothetical protein
MGVTCIYSVELYAKTPYFCTESVEVKRKGNHQKVFKHLGMVPGSFSFVFQPRYTYIMLYQVRA